MKNPMITFMCLGLLVLSGCVNSPVFFSLDTSIAPEKYLEQGIAIDRLNGMLIMVSSKDDSTVTLFVPTIASDLVYPTITVVAENKAMETALFGPENIAAIQQGQIRLAYNFHQWENLLLERNYRVTPFIAALFIGAVVLSPEFFVISPLVAAVVPVSGNRKSSSYRWHGPAGHLTYLYDNNYYNNVQLQPIAYASGNYLQRKLINSGELATGTVVLPFDSNRKNSNLVVQISMGSEIHEFNLALN